MTDPLACLRNASIGIAIWNIIYSLIQLGVMGWQVKEVKDRQWEYENRQIPNNGAIDGFQARFPGLYQLYTETPDRRRINALYVLVLICLILSFVHFFSSVALLYGCIKYRRHFIWQFFPSAACLIIVSTAYAVLWWSGDVFNEQLTMSVFEFVMSLAVNGVCLVVVVFFYSRLVGLLTSDRPGGWDGKKKGKHHRSTKQARIEQVSSKYGPTYIVVDDNRERRKHRHRKRARDVSPEVPPWREEWPSLPDVQLQKKIRRSRRGPGPRGRDYDGFQHPDSVDFYAPEVADPSFPWKVEKMANERKEKKLTQAEIIEKMYYDKYPEELPDLPHGMRSSLKKQRTQNEHREEIPPYQRNSVV